MAKIKATAAEIRDEIQSRIAHGDELDGDCKQSRAPTPRFTHPRENNGCNWTVDVVPGVIPGCLDFVKVITQQVMTEYELIE